MPCKIKYQAEDDLPRFYYSTTQFGLINEGNKDVVVTIEGDFMKSILIKMVYFPKKIVQVYTKRLKHYLTFPMNTVRKR